MYVCNIYIYLPLILYIYIYISIYLDIYIYIPIFFTSSNHFPGEVPPFLRSAMARKSVIQPSPRRKWHSVSGPKRSSKVPPKTDRHRHRPASALET